MNSIPKEKLFCREKGQVRCDRLQVHRYRFGQRCCRRFRLVVVVVRFLRHFLFHMIVTVMMVYRGQVLVQDEGVREPVGELRQNRL